MTPSLWTQTLADFRTATASAEPTPGGGSVSLVSASLGMGLVLMALEITRRKPEAGTEAALDDLLARGRKLLELLGVQADEDVVVFQNFMSAYRLPKQTDDEKAARKKAVQEALVKATLAPLSAARSCVEALELAQQAAEKASKNVVSDVGAGAALLGGAVTAVLLNVDVNLPGLGDSVMSQECAANRGKLAGRARDLTAAVLARVAARLA